MSSLKPLMDYLDKQNVNTDQLRNERKEKWERMFAKYTSSGEGNTDENSITLDQFEQLYPDTCRIEIENPHSKVFRKYMRQHGSVIDQLTTLSGEPATDEEDLDQSEYEFLDEYEDDFGDMVADKFDKSENKSNVKVVFVDTKNISNIKDSIYDDLLKKENIETSRNDSSSLFEDSDSLCRIVKERNNASVIQISTPLCNVSPVTPRGEKSPVKKFTLFHKRVRSTLESPAADVCVDVPRLLPTSKSDLLTHYLTGERLPKRNGSCIHKGTVQNSSDSGFIKLAQPGKTRITANIEDSTDDISREADEDSVVDEQVKCDYLDSDNDDDCRMLRKLENLVGARSFIPEKIENHDLVKDVIIEGDKVKHVKYPPYSLLDKMESLQLKGNSCLDVAISPANSTPISSLNHVKKSVQNIETTENILKVETSKYCENYGEADLSSEYESESNVSGESLASGYVSSLSPTSHYTRRGK